MKNVIKGKCEWAKVHEPDTKFDPDGLYSIEVTVPETEAVEMCEYLDGLVKTKITEEIKANNKRSDLTTKTPYSKTEEGEIKFKFKLKAKVKTRDGQVFSQRPLVVDSKRTPLTKDTLIGNGSIVKVAFEPYAYSMMSSKTCSVSLRLKGVQVLQLVEFQAAGSFFDEEDDGFIAKAEADKTGDMHIEADF